MSNKNQLDAPITIEVVDMQQAQQAVEVHHRLPEAPGSSIDGSELWPGHLIDVIKEAHRTSSDQQQ